MLQLQKSFFSRLVSIVFTILSGTGMLATFHLTNNQLMIAHKMAGVFLLVLLGLYLSINWRLHFPRFRKRHSRQTITYSPLPSNYRIPYSSPLRNKY